MNVMNRKRIVAIATVLAVMSLGFIWRSSQLAVSDAPNAEPTMIDDPELPARGRTMGEVLDMARAARERMSQSLDDYTARLVKREVDTKGIAGEETEMLMKVQTRLRGDTGEAPMRVYLKFQRPDSVQGREVMWVEAANDGKMAVFENYFPLSLKTIWLDPNGYLAMQGQRYPISEIGLVRLVEKLIERGQKDRDNPDIEVTVDSDHVFDEVATELIQVKRKKPGGGEDDFSLAEIVIDPERQLILSYRSFGWPETAEAPAPLLESYQYYDLQTNVGLTDADFDTNNPSYAFP
jgi:hypothetical protein